MQSEHLGVFKFPTEAFSLQDSCSHFPSRTAAFYGLLESDLRVKDKANRW